MRTSQTKHISELAKQLVAEYAKFNKPCQIERFQLAGINDPLNELELHRITQGDRNNRPNGITINSFERITFVKKSKCVISGKQYFHCLGYRSNFDEVYFLILKLVK